MNIVDYLLMLFSCLYRTEAFLYDSLICDFRSVHQRFCEISFILFMWLDVMICLVFQIGNYIYKVYFVGHLCVLGWENHLVIRLPVKEPS